MKELLKNSHPKVFDELIRPENPKVNKEKLYVNSSQKMIWKCSIHPKHIWSQSVRARAIAGYGCPYCSGNKTLEEDSLAVKFPEVLESWVFEKNLNIDPFAISPNSNRIAVWSCQLGHEREIEIFRFANERPKCSKCISIEALLINKHPKIATEFHSTKNNDLDLKTLGSSSKTKVWWQCQINKEHSWRSTVATRVRSKAGCPSCVRESFEGRMPTLDKYTPEIAAQWNYQKNGGLKPSDFTAGSRKKVWWVCPINKNHEWQASIGNRATKKRGCPKCSKGGKSLYEHSPHIAKLWHPTKNSDLTPSDVSYGSSKKVWWRCVEFNEHEWSATVTSQTRYKSARCPFCTGYRVDHRNSLAANSTEISKEWNFEKNGELTPDNVTKTSGKKVWWRCKINPDHEWESTVKNRTLLKSGCPECWKDWNSVRIQKDISGTAYLNSGAFKAFSTSLAQIKKLINSDERLEKGVHQSFFRMLHISLITAMETYLSDSFFQTITNDDDLLYVFLTKNEEYKSKKYSTNEVIGWMKEPMKEVENYVFGLAWHNLPKIKPMYQDILGVSFPDEMGPVFRSVSIRHDIVHRNGRGKDGSPVRLSKQSVVHLLNEIKRFIHHVDLELAQKLRSKRQSETKGA